MAENYEIADMIVSLGGDINNTVPRYGVTAAECAVLQAIHGNDAVNNLKITDSVRRSNRAEKARIIALYAPHEMSNGAKVIAKLYPGAAARMFERYDELDIAESQFAHGHVPEGFSDSREDEAAEVDEGLAAIDDEPGEDPFADEKGEGVGEIVEAAKPEGGDGHPRVTTTSSRRAAKAADAGALA